MNGAFASGANRPTWTPTAVRMPTDFLAAARNDEDRIPLSSVKFSGCYAYR